ncbi:MAG: hypothetical protein DHS80DRAFT_28697 [Piptocephalis tieghemiana]|nr:MAG: hypothetical protein DHS80DRAFT_28697 [Piptocephalis tieghemiana]
MKLFSLLPTTLCLITLLGQDRSRAHAHPVPKPSPHGFLEGMAVGAMMDDHHGNDFAEGVLVGEMMDGHHGSDFAEGVMVVSRLGIPVG